MLARSAWPVRLLSVMVNSDSYVQAPVVAGCGFAPRDDEATQTLGYIHSVQSKPARAFGLNPKS